MYKRILPAALALLLCILGACGKGDGSGGEFRFPLAAMPVNLDSAIAARAEEALVLANCMEGLVRRGENGVVPGVAASWELSQDGRGYTFHLRQDTHWMLTADAKELLGDDDAAFETAVTAHDFVFAFRRLLDPQTKAVGASLLFPIQNAREINAGLLAPTALAVAAPDPFTLTVTLAEPNAGFLQSLCQSGALPCNQRFFEKTGGRYGLSAKFLLCNGAFYLSAWNDTSLRFKRNNGYRGAEKIQPAGLTFKLAPDSSEQLRLLGAEGGYSALLLPPGTLTEEKMGVALQNATQCLVLRGAEGSPLCNTALRQALCAAIDPTALGFLSVPEGLLPNSLQLGGEAYRAAAGTARGMAFSEAAAREAWERGLLAWQEAGGETPIRLTLLCPAEEDRTVRLLLQQWQKVFGLRLHVTIESPDADRLNAMLAAGAFDIAFVTMRAGSSSAPEALRQWVTGEQLLPGYPSEALYASLEDAARLPSTVQAAAALRGAEEQLLREGVFYPLAARESRLLTAPGVGGLQISPAGEILWFGRCTMNS
ncbi:MAG: peptide ABC transporter substrate-binding protein [Oscillospiraceae bacterium]|jgi:oligopeptide transport system substrate-binding protein|nr:peptide ABC transporter substrate-binding protein [Oscillospiraceae bacterium]